MPTGISLALASAVLFGASTPFAKLLLGAVDPWLMAGLLYCGAGIGLAGIHLSRAALRIPPVEAPLRLSDLPWLALVILAGGVLGPLLLMLGLAQTDAATASLLLNLESVATMGIAWVVFRENVDRRLLLGAFAIVAGAALLSWRGTTSFQGSGMLIAAACLCWGIDNNLTRKLSSADPVQIAMLKGLVAGAVNLALALAQGAALPLPGTLAAVALVGFLGYGVSLALFVLGLRHLGHRTHRRLLLARAVRRRRARGRDAGRGAVDQPSRGRRPDGIWHLAAPDRTARARSHPRTDGARAPPSPRRTPPA